MNSTTDLLFSLHARFPGLMEIAISLAKGVAIICLMWALALLLRRSAADYRRMFAAMSALLWFQVRQRGTQARFPLRSNCCSNRSRTLQSETEGNET